MTTHEEMHKDAVTAELRTILVKYINYVDRSTSLTHEEHQAMEKTRRRIEDLTALLEGYDTPKCLVCGAPATRQFCNIHGARR